MKPSRNRFSLILASALLAALCGWVTAGAPARAQESAGSVYGELDLDLRSLASSVGRSQTTLYDRTLSVENQLSDHLHFRAVGSDRYGNDNVQEAAVTLDSAGNQLKGGIVRLPFGIYNHQETYATGLIAYPLVRGDYSYQEVDWGAPGAMVSGARGNFQLEAAAVGGTASGDWGNQNRLNGVVERLQGYQGAFIVGVSRWDGGLDPKATSSAAYGFSHLAATHLTGLDARYTADHLMMRGEYIAGELGGNRENGFYIDSYYRVPHLEKWSVVGRVEELKPGNGIPMSRQLTGGVRWVAAKDWIISGDVIANNLKSAYASSWTPYAGGAGSLLFQVYHKVMF